MKRAAAEWPSVGEGGTLDHEGEPAGAEGLGGEYWPEPEVEKESASEGADDEGADAEGGELHEER